MEAIFHEKQEGSLCAQHCLNALLQGHYFTAVDLADIARQLDEKEQEQMAVAGVDSVGYRQFMEQPSSNYDDSGFFSVQVIDTALRVWGLELLPFNAQNEVARRAKTEPTAMRAYICNFGEHWLTIRKLGRQWFNLNSLLTGPELISDTYLSMFLTQLQQDGYSIFIIIGDLVECEADHLLRLCPAVQPIKPQLLSDARGKVKGQGTSAGGGVVKNSDLEKALQQSKDLNEADDKSLQKVLQMSMEGYIEESVSRMDSSTDDSVQTASGSQPIPYGPGHTLSGPAPRTTSPQGPGYTLSGSSPRTDSNVEPSAEEVRQRRLAFLSKLDNKVGDKGDSSSNAPVIPVNGGHSECMEYSAVTKSNVNQNSAHTPVVNGAEGEMSEEDMLQQAIALSMQTAD